MAGQSGTRSPGMIIALIRGIIMVAGGLFALISPQLALATLVLLGGAIIVVEGLLGLWGLLFGGRSVPNFGVALARNLVAVIVGLLVVAAPVTVSSIGVSTFVVIVALLIIAVGVLEIYLDIIGRKLMREGTFWPAIIGGGLYLLFGILLLVMPLASALVLVSIVGVLMLLYGAFQLYIAWQLRSIDSKLA